MHTRLSPEVRTDSAASARRPRRAAILATVACAMSVAAVARAQTTYVAFDLGTLGGTSVDSSVAEGVNNRGDVVGASSINGQSHAFLWTASGGMRDLGTLGGANSRAIAINDSSHVVGWAQNGAGVNRAFLWTETGGMVDLGTLGGAASTAAGINNSGQIAGAAQISGGQFRAYRWSGGEMENLGTLGGPSSSANGINDAGAVLCNSQTPNFDSYPCVFSSNRGIQLLGTVPAAFRAQAFAINNSGHVVGADPSGAVWWPSPSTAPVATRIAVPGTPTDINDSDQISGFSSGRAFVWSASAGTVFLPGDSGSANAINNSGTVVGFRVVDGQMVATRWTPGGGPVTGVRLTTDPASPQRAGTAIVLTAATTGGAAPISYRFWVQPWNGDWQLLRDWGTGSTHTWTPTSASGYNIWVQARSAGGTAVEAQAGVNFVVTPGGGGPMTAVTLSTTLASPQAAGTAITLAATGTGGTTPYEFRFWVQPWNGDWQLLRDWGPSAAPWTPTIAGGYNIWVQGRSAGGTVVEAQAGVNFVVTP